MGGIRIEAARALALAGGIFLAAAASPAAAVETFVCDDGRVLTLNQDQVSVLVKTDPCIAKYHGRDIAPQAAPPAAAQPATPLIAAEPSPAVPVDLPLPQRKPADIAAKLRTLKVDPTAPAAERKPVAIADVPSDFRHVHIINGANGGEPEYYQHTR